jgi:hypothetical protein
VSLDHQKFSQAVFSFFYGREKLKILALVARPDSTDDRISLMSSKAKAKAAPKSKGGASAPATAVKKPVRTPKNIFEGNNPEEEFIPVARLKLQLKKQVT